MVLSFFTSSSVMPRQWQKIAKACGSHECVYDVCQAGVSCVKPPKCPPVRVACRHTLWVPQVSI